MRPAVWTAALLGVLVVAATPPAVAAGPAPGLNTRGSKNPKVQIVEVADFQCPFSARVQPTLDQLLERYPDAQVLFVHQPLPFHQDARGAAVAALAAGAQGRFWEMHDLLFANGKALKPPDLKRYAEQLGLAVGPFVADATSDALRGVVDRHVAIANALGARGTPTFFINGKNLRGAQPFERFAEIVDAEIAAADQAGRRGAGWIAERTKANNADLHDYILAGNVPPDRPAEAPAGTTVDATVYKAVVAPDDPARGPADALVTLVVFSEFQCPFSRKLAPTLSELSERYGDDLRVVHKHQPLPFHKEAMPAARVAVCAHAQGRFWPVHERLFGADLRDMPEADISALAVAAGANAGALARCLADPKTQARVDADMELAHAMTARGTPTSFINGRKLTGARPAAEFATVIDEELAKARAMVEAGTPRAKVYEQLIADGKVHHVFEETVHEIPTAGALRIGTPGTGKVEIVAFVDLQCPFSARLWTLLPKLSSALGADAAVYVKHFPLSFHKWAEEAANAVACAEDQGKGRALADGIFRAQGDVYKDPTPEVEYDEWGDELPAPPPDPDAKPLTIADLAGEAGVEMGAWRACVAARRHADRVTKDMNEGRAAGIRGTPTVYVNGRRWSPHAGYSAEGCERDVRRYLLKK